MTPAWIEVDQGRRALDWHVALGDLDTVPDVTPLGHAIGARVAEDLEEFFGQGWLAKAAPPRSSTWITNLHYYWPSLGVVGAFGNVIGLWASLQLLVDEHVRGIGDLKKSLRNNFQDVAFRHGLTQARLATQGLVSGHRVLLEPRKADGNPGDLALFAGGSEVFVEVKTFNPDQSFVAADHQVSATMEYLRRLEIAYDVAWSGGLQNSDLEPARREDLRAAAQVAQETRRAQVLGSGDDPLTVTPDTSPVGTRLSGPEISSAHGPRLLRDMSKKADQTRAAGAAWIWMQDNQNALWPMGEFASYPLNRKIEALAALARPVFDVHPHLLGIVLTSASMPGGQIDNESEQTSAGLSFRRALPGQRMRESIPLHRRLLVPGQLDIVLGLCANEPEWLDKALHKLGVPGGLASLTTHHAHPSALQRTDAGLYLPEEHRARYGRSDR